MRCSPSSGATDRNNWDNRHQRSVSGLPPSEAMVFSGYSTPRRSSKVRSVIPSTGQSRPTPSYPHDNIPSSGPINSTPRSRNIWTLVCVAGCCHILPFIAGATKTGTPGFNASATHPNASSAKPFASLAMVFAVAGATSIKSALSANRMCVTPVSSSSYKLVTTGRRVSVQTAAT